MLNFRTAYGNHYKVDKNACIIRCDMEMLPSGQWIFEGLEHVKFTVKPGAFIPFKALTKDFVRDFNTCWKNGKPCYTVIDIDHGTRRIWGDGVSRIWYDDE